MTSTSFVTQSPVGCIISQIINGLLSIKRCNNVNESFPNQDHDQHVGVNLHNQRLREYTVILSSGEPVYILARNGMDAAYSALELSEERNNKLVNIHITDEWQEEEEELLS